MVLDQNTRRGDPRGIVDAFRFHRHAAVTPILLSLKEEQGALRRSLFVRVVRASGALGAAIGSRRVDGIHPG
jgi:hypothetical protein